MAIPHALRKHSTLALTLCAALTLAPLTAHADAAGEVATAAKHAGMSAASNALPMAQAHLHHVLNCLVGPGGNGFDQNAANPCKDQGNGAIPDTTDATTKRQLERIATRTGTALKSSDLATVKKDAARIERELKAVKS